MIPTRKLPVLGVLLLALSGAPGPAPLSAQTPLAGGQAYPAGTELAAALAGVTFTVPAGFQAGWDPDLQAVLMGGGGGEVLAVAVWGWSEGTLTEIEAVVGQRLEEAGIRGALRSQPEVTETEARAWYDVLTPEGPGLLRGVIRVGEAGNAAAVAALGRTGAEEETGAMVDGVLASLELGAPGAAAWRGEVEGTVLSTSATSSDYSPGGAGGGGSAASRSRSVLQLCGTGYAYETESESYISIEGASASNTSRDAHQGAWWLVADLLGNATLVLEASDGRLFHWEVEDRGEAVMVAGETYGVAGSCPGA